LGKSRRKILKMPSAQTFFISSFFVGSNENNDNFIYFGTQ